MLFRENTADDRVVNVVDCPMGAGKTSAMINYMNSMPEDERVIYCTPYIEETKRVARICRQKSITYIKEDPFDGKKSTDLKKRISKGENVSCSHRLLAYFDGEVLTDIRNGNYTLVIDEAYDVVCSVNKNAKKSLDFLLEKNIVTLNENTGHISFSSEHDAEMCPHLQNGMDEYIRSNHAYLMGNEIFIAQFPVDVLNAFKRVVVMTYMFRAQIIYYYLMVNGYRFNYVGVRKLPSGEFELCPPELSDGFRYDVAAKIHIYDDEKLNSIGNGRTALSSGWYKRNGVNDKSSVMQLGRNYTNFQRHIYNCSAKDFMWTCFGGDRNNPRSISARIAAANKNIAKGYVPCNARAENTYSDRHYLAYGINWFEQPDIYKYFKSKGYEMDMDGWALSMMLQWIWRSAIRNGEDIYIYIPSKKMRTLLINWMNSIRPTKEVNAPNDKEAV